MFAPRLNLAAKIKDSIGYSMKQKMADKMAAKIGGKDAINVPAPGLIADECEVSIFELNENMGKHYPVNRVTLRIIDALKPASFDQVEGEDMELEAEIMNLKFAKMKITAKLAMFNFELKLFFENLDVKMNDRILLYKLFSKLAEKYSIYFSVAEQIAVRNALFPQARDEDVTESRTREVILGLKRAGIDQADSGSPNREIMKTEREMRKKMGLNYKTFLEVLIFSQAEFQVNIKEYMVTKWDFVDYVMTQWHDHLTMLSK